MTTTIKTANPSSFQRAPLWDEQDFVPGRVQTPTCFWANTILSDHPDREQFLSWLQGVQLDEFVNPEAAGVFQRRQYAGKNLTAIELPNNAPPPSRVRRVGHWRDFEKKKTGAASYHGLQWPIPPLLMHPRQREGLRVLKKTYMDPRQREGLRGLKKIYRTFCIYSLTLGETQSGVDRHLETNLLGTCSKED